MRTRKRKASDTAQLRAWRWLNWNKTGQVTPADYPRLAEAALRAAFPELAPSDDALDYGPPTASYFQRPTDD